MLQSQTPPELLHRLALTEALISSPAPYPIARAGSEDRMPMPPNMKLKITQSTPPANYSAANAYQAGSKYAAKLPVEDAGAFRRKLGGFLHRRGFEGDVLGQTVEQLWRELSNPLHSDIDTDPQRDQTVKLPR